MTTIAELNQHIRGGALPLRVAVEFSAAGALSRQWRMASSWDVVELLVTTRWRTLFDGLCDVDARFVNLEMDVAQWPDLDRVEHATREIFEEGRAGSLETMAFWRFIRDLGPPTLDEIVRAAEARADR